MPKQKQTLLFSATFSREIKSLASGLLKDPVLVEVARENSTAGQISQVVHLVDKSRKRELLSQLIKAGDWKQVLVFTRTKHGANKLTKQLEEIAGIKAAAIHGNKSQGARTKALASFKANEIRALVATDIAARGIDIEQLPHVVNFELPNVPEDYVHRIGRTGRAGMKGEAVSLVCVDELELLRAIEKFTKSSIKKVDIEAFRPDPSIEAEPIQNGRGGGKRGGGNNRNKKNNSRNRNNKSNNKPSEGSGFEGNKTQNSRKKRPHNPHAEKIGSNLQAKLDNMDKRQPSTGSGNNKNRGRR